MKAIPVALFLLTGLLPSIGQGQQVRVSVLYVELPHEVLTALLADSPANAAVHGKTMEMVLAKKARIVETCIGVCQNYEKATFESVREEIFPTEVLPPAIPCSIGNSPPSTMPPWLAETYYTPKHRSWSAFETHEIGTKLEIEAEVLEGNRFISLCLNPEVSSRLRLETMMEYRDKRGDSSVRMPIYETWRTSTQLTLRSGRFSLASVIAPKRQPPAPVVESRILLFVRADVLPDQ